MMKMFRGEKNGDTYESLSGNERSGNSITSEQIVLDERKSWKQATNVYNYPIPSTSVR